MSTRPAKAKARAYPRDPAWALRWRRDHRVMLTTLERRQHLKTLERMPIRLNPGQLHVVAIRLRHHLVPASKLHKARVGEPTRLETEIVGKP